MTHAALFRRAAERHRADRHPRHRAVGRLAPPRPAEGRRPGRRAARRRLHLLPPRADRCATGQRRSARSGRCSRPSSRPRRRRPAARRRCAAGGSAAAAQGELRRARRAGHQRAAARAGPELGRLVAALGHLLPPPRVADLGCGEGYLTIEASRWASRSSPSIDRRRCSSGRARWRRAAGVRNVIWKRGELERLPLATRRSTSRCCRRRCTTPPIRRAPRRGGPDRRARRPRARPRSARARRGVGPRAARRSLARVRDDELAELLKGAGPRTSSVGVGARRTGDPFTVLIASGRARKPTDDRQTKDPEPDEST